MLKIKLARYGKRNQPEYRIVVNEARDKRDGQYVALIGQYAPTHTPKILQFDAASYQEWVNKGAQPTATVAALFKRFQSGKPFPPKKKQLSKKAQAKAAAAKAESARPTPSTHDTAAPSAPAAAAEISETGADTTQPETTAPAAETVSE